MPPPASSLSAPTLDDTPASALSEDVSGDASAGIIAGVVVGVILLVASAILAAYLWQKKKAKKTDDRSIPATPAGVQMTAAVIITVQEGPLGLGLRQTEEGKVVVSSVDAGSAAEAQGAAVGLVVHELNGESAVGLPKSQVLARLKALPRPWAIALKAEEGEVENMI